MGHRAESHLAQAPRWSISLEHRAVGNALRYFAGLHLSLRTSRGHFDSKRAQTRTRDPVRRVLAGLNLGAPVHLLECPEVTRMGVEKHAASSCHIHMFLLLHAAAAQRCCCSALLLPLTWLPDPACPGMATYCWCPSHSHLLVLLLLKNNLSPAAMLLLLPCPYADITSTTSCQSLCHGPPQMLVLCPATASCG
jgi:hypothetical protein